MEEVSSVPHPVLEMAENKIPKTEHTSSSLNGDKNPTSGENDAEHWLEPSDHPLLNHVILDTLSKYIGLNELKASRLVCRKWNPLALPLARSTFAVTIIDDDSTIRKNRDTLKISEFLKMYESYRSKDIPVTRFRLGSFDPTIGAGEKFLQLCGESAKKIDMSRFGREVFFVEDLSAILKSTKNMEHFIMPSCLLVKDKPYYDYVIQHGYRTIKLFPDPEEIPSLERLRTFDLGDEEPRRRRQACPTFLDEFLSAAENISTLLTSDTNPKDRSGLEILNTLDKLERGSRIEVLSLTHVDGNVMETMRKLVSKEDGLKLKHLSIKNAEFVSNWQQILNIPPNVSWDQLVELMSHSLVSLRVLKTFGFPNHFSRMPELELLDLEICGNDPNSNRTLHDFSNNFPELKYLRLVTKERVELDEFYAGSVCCPIMETLIIGTFIMSNRTFERTLDVFPNLKELHIRIPADGGNILPRVWAEMTRLEKLIIHGHLLPGYNIESLVTGFPIGEIKKITAIDMKNLSKNMTMEARKEIILDMIDDYKEFPSIRNLTNIQYLTLDLTSRRGRQKPYLGDLAGFLGIYFLKNLRHFNIACCKFSKPCCKILVSDMELETWNFHSPGQWEVIPSRPSNFQKFWNWKFPNSKFQIN